MRSLGERVYGALFRRVLNPAWEHWIRHRPTLEYWRRLEQTQWASRDELEAMQLVQFQKLIRHAWQNVPLYRRRMEAACTGPEDFRTLDDLRRLPILTRNEANKDPEARKSTAPPFVAVRKVTSGSSGIPLVLGYDWDSEYWRQAVKLRGYSWGGYKPGATSLHFWGLVAKKSDLQTKVKVKLDRALKREHFVDCGSRGEAELQHVVDEIRRLQPEFMVCYTQAAADLARFVNERGLRDWPDIPVICGAERLFPTDRPAMEKAFGKGLFETYGGRETMLMASETDSHDGLLVPMENILLEVVVRDEDGKERAAEPGETGEVVVTDLHNFAMPFIRYANGDLATLGPRSKSGCGRAHMRLSGIEGRTTETMTDARGGKVSGLTFNVLFSSMGDTVRQFQAVQHKDRSVTLRIVPSDKFDPKAEKAIRDVAARYLPGLPFKLQTVSEIACNPSGKRMVLVVEK